MSSSLHFHPSSPKPGIVWPRSWRTDGGGDGGVGDGDAGRVYGDVGDGDDGDAGGVGDAVGDGDAGGGGGDGDGYTEIDKRAITS